MATLNGIGTDWRGWRHAPDGTSTATRWVTFVFLPLLPLRRHRLRTLTDFESERFPRNPLVVAAALGGGVEWSDPVEVRERLPLDWAEVGVTYFWCYVLLPLLCVAPVVLGRLLFRTWLPSAGIEAPQAVHIGFALLALGWIAAVLIVAVRRMRGARPGQ